MQLKNFHHKYPVLFHLILMTLASGFILMGILFGLDIYTRHDSSIVMPELRGKDLKEAERLLSSHNLRYELVDSVYDKSLAQTGADHFPFDQCEIGTEGDRP